MNDARPKGVVSRLSGVRRRVILIGSVILIGILVHIALFYVASVPVGPGPREVKSTPWIGWEEADAPQGGPVVREQTLLLDAEPLFVPTAWNTASDLGNIASLRDEAELFAPFPVRLGSAAAIWRPPAGPDSGELLAERWGRQAVRPFRLLGREAGIATTAVRSRLPRVEVVDIASGEIVGASRALDAEGATIPEGIWSPLEFLVVVDPASGGGLPLRLNSSGFPEWDQVVARALARHRPLAALPNGYFRVTVGP